MARWASVAIFFVVLGLTQAWEEPLPEDRMLDDHTEAISRLRKRIAETPLTSSLAVVMATGPKEKSWSTLSIPIWRAYCEKHGYDFFLQEEPLNTDLRFDWAKPRMLMELLPKAKWKYVMLVESNTLPANFNKSWEYAIKEHMRQKRYNNDEPEKRLIFCPWDCEEEYENAYEEGVCYGPLVTGCIFWAKKPKTLHLVKSWYSKRDGDFAPETAVVKALHKMKERNWDEVFYKDVMKEIGRKTSSLVAVFSYDEKHGWNVRDQIHEYILKRKELSILANDLDKHEL